VQRVPARNAGPHPHVSRHRRRPPEADEIDIKSKPRISASTPSALPAPDGQSVNTTIFRRAITHLPTGLVVSQQDEKSPNKKNRAKAMRVLPFPPLRNGTRKAASPRSAPTPGQIKTGDRSEKNPHL